VTSGSVTKTIGDLFKEVFLVFSIVLGEDFSVFLELDIELVK
jgi:hypothetical protein